MHHGIHLAGGDKFNGRVPTNEQKIEVQQIAPDYLAEYDLMTDQERCTVFDM